ncbi:MAG: nucleoside 2-deoxyribosyltransferase [Methanosarcinaceae archaeon]|nr:nucleoside 2-deoxyribosyltransferase [Methanosarcinaceae archaeon]
MKVFFSGSIRGGRQMLPVYQHICDLLNHLGFDVTTLHVADENIDETESSMTDQEIYGHDMKMLKISDCLIAEVTVPSIGVGYEICRALERGLPVLCLHDPQANVSAMILGNPEIKVKEYTGQEHLENILRKFTEPFRNMDV